VDEVAGRGKAAALGHVPFTGRAKRVLELSLRESLQLGHRYIGTEHILLGLTRVKESVGAKVMQNLGADLEEIRQHVTQLLGESGSTGQVSGSTGQVVEPPPRFILELDERISQAVAGKDAALDEGDVERAFHFRSEERGLLEEKASPEVEWRSATQQINQKIAEIRAEKEGAIDEQDFKRAARLRDEERRLLDETSSLRRRPLDR
jgi:ATP-dependent Clp protease ATP-binding subunit ClpA